MEGWWGGKGVQGHNYSTRRGEEERGDNKEGGEQMEMRRKVREANVK